MSPRTREAEERRADDGERAAPRESTTREARRRSHEVHSMYGYASEPRRRSYPDLLLTLRNRCDEDWRCDILHKRVCPELGFVRRDVRCARR